MKKAGIIGIIVAVHCVLIGAVLLLPGCGTTPKPVEPQPPQVVMPPPVVTPPPVERIEPIVTPPARVEPPVAPASKTYAVKAGDSLSLIAKRFNVSQRDIMKLNKITDANKLRVGQKLTLPGYVDLNAPVPPRPKKAAVVKKTTGKAHAAAAQGEYVVKSGDSLGKIAAAHGTTVAALKAANGLASDKLQIGQKLSLSGGKKPAEASEAAPAGEAAPALEAPVAPIEAAPAAPVEVKSNEVLHVVEPNQDLNSIAMMYGVRVEDMMKLNNLASPDVKVGQTLKIPPPVE